MYLFIKAALSGMIILVVSEIARRSPSIGALIVSLPLISVLSILWLWRDTANTELVASHAYATFWFVLPTLPMFLVLPALLRHGVHFWLAMAISCVLTVALYMLTMWILPKIGIRI